MRALVTAVAAALALGACVADTAETTTTAPTTLPAPTTTSIPTTTTLPPTTIPATTTVPEAGDIPVYFFFAGYPIDPGPWVIPVARPGVADIETALAALLDGVSAAESDMGLSSTIPEGTRLLGVEVEDGVAAIDLSGEFESGGGSLSILGRVAQLVYTATRFDGVDAVVFLIEGTRVDVLGGEGLILEDPQTREGYRDLLPGILLEEPIWGQAIGGQMSVSGLAMVDSELISYTVIDADGFIVAEGLIPSTPGEWSEFSAIVEISAGAVAGTGSIVVFETAEDGSQRHVLQYPLTISG
jgi:hypothetical protein